MNNEKANVNEHSADNNSSHKTTAVTQLRSDYSLLTPKST